MPRKPKQTPAPVQKHERVVETAADRRAFYRRMAGWPAEKHHTPGSEPVKG